MIFFKESRNCSWNFPSNIQEFPTIFLRNFNEISGKLPENFWDVLRIFLGFFQETFRTFQGQIMETSMKSLGKHIWKIKDMFRIFRRNSKGHSMKFSWRSHEHLLEFSRHVLEFSRTKQNHRTFLTNCLRFANPAEAIGDRHSEAWRLRCVEAQKLGGHDMLIFKTCWIFLMSSWGTSKRK